MSLNLVPIPQQSWARIGINLYSRGSSGIE